MMEGACILWTLLADQDFPSVREKGTMWTEVLLLATLQLMSTGLQGAESARILSLLNVASPSHYIFNRPLMLALANRGHQMTVVSPDASKDNVPNLTNIKLEGVYDTMRDDFDFENLGDTTASGIITVLFEWADFVCQKEFKSDGAKKLLNYPSNDQFDLIIVEAGWAECFYGFIHKFGSPPVVATSPYGLTPWMDAAFGAPDNPSYMPVSILSYTSSMTFTQKLYNAFIHYYHLYRYLYEHIPNMEAMAKEFFKQDLPSFVDIQRNFSLVLENTVFGLEDARPLTPNIIPIGGMHVKEKPDPLPKVPYYYYYYYYYYFGIFMAFTTLKVTGTFFFPQVVVITEDVQNGHLLLEYRPHIDVSLTCEHDPKLQEYCVCPQNMPQFDSEGIPNQAPETNKPMILNGPTTRNREGSDQAPLVILMNGLHQLLVYADDVNMLGENPQTIRENAEILVEASKAIGLEVNPEKTKYMIMSRDQNIVRNGNIKIGDLSFEEMEKFKYLGATVTNINDTREEIKRRINMGNVCYYSVEKLLSSSLLSKNLKVRIYKTVILPVVLYDSETWTLTLREEQRLRVFENKVLRKIFGAKRDEVTGEWRKLHNAELHALYTSPDIIRNIKSRRLRWAGHVASMGESRNAYRVLVGRPEGKRPLGRPRRRWEKNIKMDLREVGYDGRDWINLAQDRDQWRAYVRATMNLRVP
ncbi:hypothetical protein ANN_20520 [Periplaneta americana]|uniref:Reverse transcriptase domain-containing protein n=1 Tax=Periplaneta americana TaxID=6978 RepID=A0ABQ8SDI0_PERAM|nr:hypothetical protein ANN_20520 [Periplaneta americana]